MHSPTADMVTEVRSQLYSIMDTPVGTPAMEEIDTELAPILRYLIILGPKYEQPQKYRNFVEWFLHPNRTANQFNYVVGPLRHDVFMEVQMSCDDISEYPRALCLAAAEALAVRCPVLVGSWEYAAWMVVRIVQSYDLGDIVSNWIIKVIGNADICPNANLRMELMSLLSKAEIDIHNQTQAVEAVMSACSALNNDYLESSLYGEFSILTFSRLTEVFERIMGIDILSDDVIGNGCLLDFGAKLANQLEYVNNMWLSRPLYDVSCQYGMNPYKYTEPRELYSLIALLETINGCVQLKLKDSGESNFLYFERSDTAYDMFNILIKNFTACFQMPQLTNPTAKLVMGSIELLLSGIEDDENDDMNLENIIEFDSMIKCLFNIKGSCSTGSPLRREIISYYRRKLLVIQEYIASYSNYINYFNTPTIIRIIKLVL
ncbi:unnamed protein product [Meganyctiphanes norvegica]|uniref:Uncharacterized protein n=1 Tax=Meganyctiphanes norvegica TaxID=48144 RepID=A0AAV2SRD2_MEGNR